MYSNTDICKMALGLLEEAPVTSYDDDTSRVGNLCRVHLPISRDTLLRSHPWNFAVERASLAADSTAPTSGFAYRYAIPADCLRVLPLEYNAEQNGGPIRHAIEGRYIATDWEAPLKIRYIKRVTDASQFDVLFVDALAKTLAGRLASYITGKQSYGERMMQMAAEAVKQARLLDALEGTPDDPDNLDFAYARWGFDPIGTNFRGE